MFKLFPDTNESISSAFQTTGTYQNDVFWTTEHKNT